MIVSLQVWSNSVQKLQRNVAHSALTQTLMLMWTQTQTGSQGRTIMFSPIWVVNIFQGYLEVSFSDSSRYWTIFLCVIGNSHHDWFFATMAYIVISKLRCVATHWLPKLFFSGKLYPPLAKQMHEYQLDKSVISGDIGPQKMPFCHMRLMMNYICFFNRSHRKSYNYIEFLFASV